jgi:hypothetical protein
VCRSFGATFRPPGRIIPATATLLYPAAELHERFVRQVELVPPTPKPLPVTRIASRLNWVTRDRPVISRVVELIEPEFVGFGEAVGGEGAERTYALWLSHENLPFVARDGECRGPLFDMLPEPISDRPVRQVEPTRRRELDPAALKILAGDG